MAIETNYRLFSTNFSYYSSETPTNITETKHASPPLSHLLEVSKSIIGNKTKLINSVKTPELLGQHSKTNFDWCLHLSMKQTMLSSHYEHSNWKTAKPLMSSTQSSMNLSRKVESMTSTPALHTTRLHYHHGSDGRWPRPTQFPRTSLNGLDEQETSTKQNELIETLARHFDTVDLSDGQRKRKFDEISKTPPRCP